MLVGVIVRSKLVKGEHSEGKGGEQAMKIMRL
jgi:hypothetical protein